MNAEIFANNEWHSCELSYPHSEPPIKVPGPMGTESWQKGSYSECNCKVTLMSLASIIPTGVYEVRASGKEMQLQVMAPKGLELWGNIL